MSGTRREQRALWRRQNVESETMLNGSAQPIELVFHQPSGTAHMECIVPRTCQRLWKGCCDLVFDRQQHSCSCSDVGGRTMGSLLML